MATNKRDVQLVIRAKDEASKAFDLAGAALESLLNINTKVGASAGKTGSQLEELAKIGLTLDKAYSKISGAADTAAAAFGRQQQALNAARSQLAALQDQAAGAAAALAKLNSDDQIVNRGQLGQARQRLEEVKQVTEAYRGLQSQQDKLAATIRELEGQLDGQRSSLQQLGSTELAVADARARAAAEIELETAALHKQAAAAEQVSEIQQRINRLTGAGSVDPKGRDAGAAAPLLAQADARFQEIEAWRQEGAAIRVAAEAQDVFNAATAKGLVQQTKSAAQSASVFSQAGLSEFERRLQLTEDLVAAEKREADETARAGAAHAAQIEAWKREGVAIKQATDAQDAFNAATAKGLTQRSKSAADSASVFVSNGPTAFEQVDLDKQQAAAAAEAAALRDAGIAHQKFEERVREGARAMREAETAEKGEAAALAQLRSELDPLAAIQARYTAELQKLDKWLAKGKISAEEHAQALKLLGASTERAKKALAGSGAPGTGKPTLFGLKPYDIQNLGFQFNDIVTQLASGTSLTQTLAQQGGQILQIFPKVSQAIVKAFSNPFIATAAVALGTFVLGLKQAGDEAERLRGFQGVLAATVDGGDAQAAALSRAAHALDLYGLSAKDAVAIVRVFNKDGVDPARVEAFGLAAKDMADVLGIDVKDAAKQVADAFTGTYSSVKKLDDAQNFLSASQRDHIRLLFEQGKSQQALNEAFDLYAKKQNAGAEKMRGPWTDAARSLHRAWDALLDRLGDSLPVQATLAVLDALAISVKGVSDKIAELLKGPAADTAIKQTFEKVDRSVAVTDTQITQLRANVETLKKELANLGGDKPGGFVVSTGIPGVDVGAIAGQMRAAAVAEALAAAQQKLADAEARRATQASGAAAAGTAESQRQIKATEDLRVEIAELGVEDKRLSDEQRLAAAEKKARAEADVALAQENFRFADEATKQEFTRQKIAEAVQRVQEKITAEHEKQNRELRDGVLQSTKLLQNFEGFQEKAKRDSDGKFRVGFGSDTVTRQDGTIQRVTAGTTTTRDEALLDLNRRVVEFQKAIKEQIGSDRFGAFNAQQQAALTSIAYNYGSLPERIVQAVRTGTNVEMAAAVRGLAKDNGGINAKRRNREAAILEQPNLAVDADNAHQLEVRDALQEKFNQKVKDENAERKLATETLTRQQSLMGEALIVEQEQAAVAEALREKQEEINRLNVERARLGQPLLAFGEKEQQQVRETAEAYQKLLRARDIAAARADAVERPVQALRAEHDAILEQIGLLQQQGDRQALGPLQDRLVEINGLLDDARRAQIAFWESVLAGAEGGPTAFGRTTEEIRAMIAALQNAQIEGDGLRTKFLQTGEQINQSFTEGATSAFDRFAEAVANGRNVFSSLGEAFLQFSADFLREIGLMIAKQTIFNAVSGQGGQGGIGGFIAGAVGAVMGAPPAAAAAPAAGVAQTATAAAGLTAAAAPLTAAGTTLTAAGGALAGAGGTLSAGAGVLSTAAGVLSTAMSAGLGLGGGLGAAAGVLTTAVGIGVTFAAALQAAATTLLIANSMSAGGGGGGGSLSFLGSIFHKGGVVGRGGPTRAISPAWFANAQRFHAGGVPGLKAGELPAIVKRGEVIDPGDGSVFQKVFGDAAGGAAPPMTIRNVLLMDPGQVEAALASPGGERVIMATLKKNSGTVKSMVRD